MIYLTPISIMPHNNSNLHLSIMRATTIIIMVVFLMIYLTYLEEAPLPILTRLLNNNSNNSLPFKKNRSKRKRHLSQSLYLKQCNSRPNKPWNNKLPWCNSKCSCNKWCLIIIWINSNLRWINSVLTCLNNKMISLVTSTTSSHNSNKITHSSSSSNSRLKTIMPTISKHHLLHHLTMTSSACHRQHNSNQLLNNKTNSKHLITCQSKLAPHSTCSDLGFL